MSGAGLRADPKNSKIMEPNSTGAGAKLTARPPLPPKRAL